MSVRWRIDKRTRQAMKAAREAEQQVLGAARLLTTAFINLGAKLDEFDKGQHWAYVPTGEPQEGQEPVFYPSFDKWLRGKKELSYSHARLALQVYRRLVIEYEYSITTLEEIDLSKFVDIMPEIERAIARPAAEVRAEIGDGQYYPRPIPDAEVEQWRVDKIDEWVNKARGDALSRKALQAEKDNAEGWETIYAGWQRLTAIPNSSLLDWGVVKNLDRDKTFDQRLADGYTRDDEVYIEVKRRVKKQRPEKPTEPLPLIVIKPILKEKTDGTAEQPDRQDPADAVEFRDGTG